MFSSGYQGSCLRFDYERYLTERKQIVVYKNAKSAYKFNILRLVFHKVLFVFLFILMTLVMYRRVCFCLQMMPMLLLLTLYFSMVAGAYIAYLDSIQNNNSYTNREK